MIGGIDTNILIYAHDNSSPFQTQALHLLENILVRSVVAVAELSLREFYAVVTDGRKLNNPFSIDEAKDIISDIYASPKFFVCSTNQETWLNGYELVDKYNISRYRLDDLLIALTLADGGAEIIYTANIKDFKKFDFIQPIHPFSQSAEREATSAVPHAMPCAPCASRTIPYARQSIDEQDIAAVCKVLRSDWLTTGPKVEEFEDAVADYVGAKHAVAVSSGTAALHAAMFALSIGPSDEVIVPPMTFAATANCIVYQGGTPVFVDVDPNTLLIDPAQVEAKITPNTRAIIGVDYAGQPCDWDALREIADRYNLYLVDDGCHAMGAEYKGKKVGTLADMTVFSFHPVKHITTGEGGIVVTDDERYAERMRIFRTHGITRKTLSAKRRAPSVEPWFYEMKDLGYNYRITDFQCALGLSQLQKLPEFLHRRREIAAQYDEALVKILGIKPLSLRSDGLPASQSAERKAQSAGGKTPMSCDRPSAPNALRPAPCAMLSASGSMLHAPCSLPSSHAYHLYVIRLQGAGRAKVFEALREQGIGVNVHYIPVHLHPYYRKRFGTGPGFYPIAESAYENIISLPIFSGMSDEDVEQVVTCFKEAINKSN